MRADGPTACAPLAPREGGTPPRPRKLSLEGRPTLLSCAPGSFSEGNREYEDAGKLSLPSCAPVCRKNVNILSDGPSKPSDSRSLADSSNNNANRERLSGGKCKSSKKTPSPDITRIFNNNNVLHPEGVSVYSEHGQEVCATIVEKREEENENTIKPHATHVQMLSTATDVGIIKQDSALQTTSKVKKNPKSVEVFVHRQNLQPAREECTFNTEQRATRTDPGQPISKSSNDRNNQKSFSNISEEFKNSCNSSISDSDCSDRLISNEENTKTFEEVNSTATIETSLPDEDRNTSPFENAASTNESSRTSYDSFKNIECDAYLETFGGSSPTPTATASASPCARSSSDAETASSSRFNEYRISPHRNNKVSCRSKRNRHRSVSDYKCVSLDYKASKKTQEARGAENDIELRDIGVESSLFDCISISAEKKRAAGGNGLYSAGVRQNCSSNSSCDILPLKEPKVCYPHTVYRSHHPRRNTNSYSKNNSNQFNQNNTQTDHLYSFPGYRCKMEMSPPKISEHTINIKKIEETRSEDSGSTRVSAVGDASRNVSNATLAGGPLENFSSLYSYSRSIPKSKSCLEYASGAEEVSGHPAGRPLSLAGRRGGAVRHRNAEEALSCLLWQPYDCREGAGRGEPAGGAGAASAAGAAGASAHSLLAARYGETCALAMRLTVPAPAHCRAVQPAQRHAPDSEPERVGSDPVQIADSVVPISALSDERVSVSDNTVSVNGEVIGCRLVTSSCGVSQTAIQHSPRAVERTRVQVLQDAPCRSWTSCGAQTEEPPAPPLAPPPYSTLPHAHPALPLPVQPHAYPFQPVSLRRCQYGEDSEPPKTCCGAVGARALGLKWFIVLVALAGICCVLVGTVLGAVRAQGRAHLTVLLLMIGVGLVLVTVSGVAWRAVGRRRARAGAARGAATSGPGGAVRRGAAACARAHHPYAAMLYPEFHCRPPPPSYQASMHEYRLRLLLLDRAASPPPVACPPPAYRPRPRGMAGGGPPYMGRGARGRRRPEPRTPAPTLSAVVIQNIALEPYDDVKYDDGPEMEPPIGSETKEEEVQHENKEGNLVTIVQTGLDTSPVIVTVSGSMPEERTNQTHTSEIDILAHL